MSLGLLPSNVRSRLRSWLIVGGLLIAFLLPALMLVSPAAAQGTMGMLPGPITTHELDGYAQRLSVSPQQRRALDAMHDEYKREFRTMRDGEIAQFLRKMREMDGGGGMPKRKDLEDFLQQMDALSRKIAGLDNRFFDQLQTTLTEQQLTMMPRVRMARQRGRMDNMQLMWMGGQKPVDVSSIAYAVDLSEADRVAADPMLSVYETRLTGEMEKLYQNAHKAILGIYDTLEKLGITEASIQDPAQAEKMAQAMQQVWMDMMSKTADSLAGVAEMNDRTQRSISAALSPEGARNFRNHYYRLAYAECTYALFMHDYVFAPALKRDDLTPVQRESVIAARDDMQRKLDVVLDQAVADVADSRKTTNPFDYDQQAAEQHQKKQMELRGKADEIRANANESLETALGKELLDKIGRLKSSAEEPQEVVATADDIGGGMAQTVQTLEVPGEGAEDSAAPAWGVDQFLPPAISEIDINDMSERLALSDEQGAVVRDLFQRYNETFQGLSAAEFSKLQAAVAGLWQYDEQSQTSRSPTADAINDTYRLRAAALAAIQKTDDSLFSELGLAVLTPEQARNLPRVKSARERTMYNRGSGYWGGDNAEGSIDLSRMLSRRRSIVPESQRAAVDAELEKYETAALALFKERYVRSIEAQKTQELWQAEITRAQMSGDTNNITLGLRYQEMMRGPQKALAEANEAISALNRKTVDAIEALLTADAAGSLRSEYNRVAFPSVYGDPGSVDKHLKRARALPDLSPEQSQQLADLAASYHPAYTALCEEMVKASEGSSRSPYLATVDETNIDEWQKREETLSKLRFDRSELNARTAGQMQAILSEDQIKRLGGLPTAQEADEFD